MTSETEDLRAKYEDLAETGVAALGAASAAARLCEASRRLGSRRIRFARHEGLALADREGMRCDEIRLLGLLSSGVEEVVSKIERATADLMRASAMAATLVPGEVEPISLVELWTRSEAWNVRAAGISAERDARIDADAETLARLVNAFSDDPTPIEGADLVGRIVRERLFPRPDRMASLLAIPVMRRALAAPHADIGVAAHLPNPDAFAAMQPMAMARAVLAAARAGAVAGIEDLDEARVLRADLANRVSSERAGSRTSQAIDALVDVPMLGIVDLGTQLGLTHRGTNMMVQRLIQAGVVRAHRGNRSKGRLYVCDRALRRA